MICIFEVGKTDSSPESTLALLVRTDPVPRPMRKLANSYNGGLMRFASLVVFMGLTAAAAISGAAFMPGAWYQTLAKPTWTPPGWLFGPVWTVLYVMIAVAGWRAWMTGARGVLLAIWLGQMALNALWSYLMFGLHRIDLAMLNIALLLLSIVAFIIKAWPVDRAAALLFVPYAAWVSFATALNFAIWRLNP